MVFSDDAAYDTDTYSLRWIEPDSTEILLSGHSALASAHILWEEGHVDKAVKFSSHTHTHTTYITHTHTTTQKHTHHNTKTHTHTHTTTTTTTTTITKQHRRGFVFIGDQASAYPRVPKRFVGEHLVITTKWSPNDHQVITKVITKWSPSDHQVNTK